MGARARLAPLALLLLAAWALGPALMSGGALVPGAPYADMRAEFLAWRGYGFSELRAGRFALWNPYVFCGMPFFAGFEPALLYPPNWIHLALPFAWAVNLLVLLHLFLTGAAACLWLRLRGRGVPAALAGGALFMFSGPVFLRVYAGHLSILCTVAWTPLLFCAVDLWLAGAARASLALGTLAGALQILAGYPQCAYLSGLAVAAYAALEGLRRARPGRAIAGLALIYGGALALSAVQWLPGLAAASESVRSGASYGFSSQLAFPAENFVTLIAPHFFGTPERYAGRSLYWEASLAFGLVGAILACAGAFRPRREDRPLLWIAAAALLLALGPATPIYALAYRVLPGLWMMRGVGKATFIASLCLAALAASGLERIASLGARRQPVPRPSAGRRATAWALGLAALVALEGLRFAGSDCAFTSPQRPYPEEWRSVLAGLAPGERVLHDMFHFPNQGVLSRVGDLWGYAPLAPRRYAELMAAAQGQPWEHATQYLQWRRDAPHVLDLLRCRVVFPPVPGEAPVLRPRPMKRAEIIFSWEVAAGAAAAIREVVAPDFDPRTRVVLEENPGLTPASGSQGRSGANIRSFDDEDGVGLSLIVETPRPAILLVTDSFSSGWRARSLDGGRDYRVLPADHALLGVPLEAGRHRLRLEYKPREVAVGAGVSLAGAAAILLGLVFYSARRRERIFRAVCGSSFSTRSRCHSRSAR